jgi:hypothetical protein
MRRLAAALALATALGVACGGANEGGTPAAPTDPAPATVAATPTDPAPATVAATPRPTEAELATRRELLEEIRSGRYRCYCTAADRARDRIARGLVEPPPRDGSGGP